jgi:hypothetical protein
MLAAISIFLVEECGGEKLRYGSDQVMLHGQTAIGTDRIWSTAGPVTELAQKPRTGAAHCQTTSGSHATDIVSLRAAV